MAILFFEAPKSKKKRKSFAEQFAVDEATDRITKAADSMVEAFMKSDVKSYNEVQRVLYLVDTRIHDAMRL